MAMGEARVSENWNVGSGVLSRGLGWFCLLYFVMPSRGSESGREAASRLLSINHAIALSHGLLRVQQG